MESDLDARDQRGDVVGVDLERRHLGDDAPVAQHGDAVGEVEHLLEAVRDEQDRGAAGAQLVEQLLDDAGLAHAERRRRLVEHDHRRVAPHGAGDGHELALAARQRAAPPGPGWSTVDAEPFEQRPGLGHHRVLVEDARDQPLVAEEQVGDDAEVVAQGQVLPHHGHLGVAGGVDRQSAPRPCPSRRTYVRRDALHQRRLAGTVLPHEREDLGRAQHQVDA